ncbi:quinol:cytochrome C oxidoreductase [Mucilaginibacter sp. RCC_168]|uniref:quinol:cytochrome C oxidoreductase n=1 Tax=unclassified Mucilaginibacter TaxID=2617802 RepID=UPI003526AD40
MNTHNSLDEQFVFTGKAKTWSLAAIVVGVITIAGGFLLGHGERTFANLLLCGYYFACVCTAGVFFCALQYVAQAGWSASLLRVPQAFARVLPIAAVILLVIIIAGLNLTHHTEVGEGKEAVAPYLYKLWHLEGVTTPGSENYDPVLAGKSGFLNMPFFLIRIVVFLGAYAIFGWLLAKYSETEDELGGLFYYKKSFTISAAFLVIFGFTQPVFSFDVVMSLEAHWFSTMFGWYNFAAMWVSTLSIITLTIILLRKSGYMQWITQDHLHNLGQLMFGFSIFWTYVWFAQFLLIYYANIPEESVYFLRRWEPEFKPWFWLTIILNFMAPLLIIMSRDSKRATSVLKATCIILIVGHWLDYFIMIMPGTIGAHGEWWSQITPIEIGVAIGFAGLFTYLMLNALSKFKSLVPKKHPFLQESLHHHI